MRKLPAVEPLGARASSRRHQRRRATLERLLAEFGGSRALAAIIGTPDAHIHALRRVDVPAAPEVQLKNVQFAADTEFYDVEGKPVTIDAGDQATWFYCACWDRDPPRSFCFDSAIRKGVLISEADFRKLAGL